ncbi:MAG: hypothetical protein M1838_003174 [Thelocarpon superellum]|nr:MAG: hypothetical protein M1838_003174 [Thelocarpon superellum]
MLRRKTPTGTLAAGYDGSPIEWARPDQHTVRSAAPRTAIPGSLLQGGSQEAYAHNASIPFRPTNRNPVHAYPSGNEHQGGLKAGPDAGGMSWIHPSQYRPGIDSVLNQLPTHQATAFFLSNGAQIPTVLQPAYQPSLGPTASNDEGPFGPYWPDGAYIPYRPAALRDPRYYSAVATTSWSSHLQAGHHANLQQGVWSHPRPLPIPTSFELSIVPSPGTKRHGVPTETLRPRGGHRGAGWMPSGGVPGYGGASIPSSLRSASSMFATHQAADTVHPNLGHVGANLAWSDHRQIPAPGPSMHAEQAPVREKVLTWAHSVYVDLIAAIQQSSGRTAQMRYGTSQTQPPRASIYPRPPRQPGLPFPTYATEHQSTSLPGEDLPSTGPGEGPSDQHACKRLKRQPDIDPSQPLEDHGRRDYHPPLSADHARRLSDQTYRPMPVDAAYQTPRPPMPSTDMADPTLAIRRTPTASFSPRYPQPPDVVAHTTANALAALEMITRHCGECAWQWVDGMLLGGCLAYGLGDYDKALRWHQKILEIDPNHVEAISNLAATLLSLNRREEAEQYWLRSVKLRPSYFEAVEHLIGLLCGDHRGKEAVDIIQFVERSLRNVNHGEAFRAPDHGSDTGSETSRASSVAPSDSSERVAFDYEGDEAGSVARDPSEPSAATRLPGFGSSGFAVSGSENGRILALVHAKGNMLYALGHNAAAARAFEDAILIGAGRRKSGIQGLIRRIARAMSPDAGPGRPSGASATTISDPILLPPERALQTAKSVFPHHGDLPGLRYIPNGIAKKAAISTMSNSLLSLAKIFQDGMSSGAASGPKPATGVRDILALYYLSLALQPSPSTANNVGILLASVQQAARPPSISPPTTPQLPALPGVDPGSGVALALAYYNYGLNLDNRHAHLYTNLGSLLKDIGQLAAAIKMYEQAVACDPNFDIALANLANAVKDHGRVSDAIGYYRRAVTVSPDFAEAVCGLANALNSVCGWTGRGGALSLRGDHDRWHVDERGMLTDARGPSGPSGGWIRRVVDIVEKQLGDGEAWGRGVLTDELVHTLLGRMEVADGWSAKTRAAMERSIKAWSGQSWEGARLVRLVERIARRLGWQWYQDQYVRGVGIRPAAYVRPLLPAALSVPAAPTVLPFHTFTCPLSAKQIRQISQRNGLRISCSTLRAPWLPATVYRPPPPPAPHLNVGYVSSDFNNHPLAHLMQSVFGLHHPSRVKAFCYATTVGDQSVHRQQIEREAPVFYDASSWSAERLVQQIVEDGIHIIVNLNGYTRGARNEVFAARPAPIQMSFMGFAGTLGAEWCDYLLADDTAVPPETLRPWRGNVDLVDQIRDASYGDDADDWVYSENVIFARDTFFCCDHRQSAPDSQGPRVSWEEEQDRRWGMRKELFPQLPDDMIVLGNFNQLYKIEPTTFRSWLRILSRLPNAVLWLLRFPELGEQNLKRTAQLWAGQEVASRVLFTDVAPKHQHIARARVCDLFLDTPECNAHTTAADVLWSGTPLLTLPRYQYKMCSRMAASILKGALPKTAAGQQAAAELIARSEHDYEDRAVSLGAGLHYGVESVSPGRGRGRLVELRRLLYESRWTSALFDTRRWVDDLEEAYAEAWRRWVAGEGGDIWL